LKNLPLILISSFLFSSCISYHIAEKDLFSVSKVSKLSKDVQLEEINFTTSDSVNLYGWFSKTNNARGTFLYFGGNGFYVWNRLTPDIINVLTGLKMNLMLIDYRGFGKSGGTPSISGIYEDGYATYRYLCSRTDIDSTRIIVYGHSLGTFVATQVAKAYPVAGVILEGAISNAPDMRDAALQKNAPWYIRWLVNIDADSAVMRLDNTKQVKDMNCPLLVITGEKDDVAPPWQGKKIFETAPGPVKKFEIIPKGEHKDLYISNNDGRRDYYIRVLSKYLDDILGKEQL
jgi:fermentation-respiration switch protein FrsA (DUF1100 family)